MDELGAEAATVLVVEDNPTNLKLVRALLRRAGYCTLEAGSAEEALACLATAQPDLILMDIQLPDVDGLELTRRLKADAATAAIPVVALTAYAMTGDRELALRAGCIDHITKPIDTRTFAGKVAAALSDHLSSGGRDEQGAADPSR